LNAKLQELGASASDSLQFLTHSIQTACFPEILNLAHSGLLRLRPNQDALNNLEMKGQTMRHEEILHRCFRCGFCKFPSDYSKINCPAYLKYRFESFSPGGRMWLIRAWLAGEVQNDERLQEVFFSCAACGNCVEHCIFDKFRDQILEAFIAAKEEMIGQGRLPPSVRDYLTHVFEHGNPYKAPQKKRGDWAKPLGVSVYSGQDYLFYVGDVGCFDSRGMEIAGSVAWLFQKLKVPFGILGPQEISCGNEARYLGEADLFRYLAEKNIQTFRQMGVKKIVTLSPHGYNAIKNYYPQFGGGFEVLHYTHLLLELLASFRIFEKPASSARVKVTFHDPCYLGRHNKDYDTPRTIIGLLPGIELVEMKRNRSDSLCCGGGGANFFTNLVCSGEETSAAVRAEEAADTGAQILVTACPICTVMLEGAVKSKNLESKIQVRELSELVREAWPQE
jgi:Fe-S oxidoreductase